MKGVKGDLESEVELQGVYTFHLTSYVLSSTIQLFVIPSTKKLPYNLTWLTFLKRWQLHHTVHVLKCKNAERQIAEDQAFCCMQYRKALPVSRDFDAMTTLIHFASTCTKNFTFNYLLIDLICQHMLSC